MKTINPPNVDSMGFFANIIASKNALTKGTLNAIFNHIEFRYSEYSTHKTDLAGISPSSLNLGSRQALLQCYLGETKEVKRLKAQIKENHISSAGMRCQFCGIENITTYDHYLPKESFPDFSIHAPNLIPCCSTCNNKKRTTFLTALGERAIINLYFESLPNDRYLFSEIEYKNNVPTANFYLNKPSSHSDYLFRLVSEHYLKLNLLNRYRENAPEVLSETRVSIISHAQPASEDIVKDWLRIEALNISNRYSENNWKVALFYAMVGCTEFINSCL